MVNRHMVNIEIIPFEIEHALEIMVRSHEEDLKRHEDFRKWAEMNCTPGTSFSGFYEDRLVGCGGVRILWPGVGEGWVLFAPEIKTIKREAYVYVGTYLKKIMDDNGLWRVQAHAREDFPMASRYLENLGFVCEGLMRKFGPMGRNHYLYAFVR